MLNFALREGSVPATYSGSGHRALVTGVIDACGGGGAPQVGQLLHREHDQGWQQTSA